MFETPEYNKKNAIPPSAVDGLVQIKGVKGQSVENSNIFGSLIYGAVSDVKRTLKNYQGDIPMFVGRALESTPIDYAKGQMYGLDTEQTAKLSEGNRAMGKEMNAFATAVRSRYADQQNIEAMHVYGEEVTKGEKVATAFGQGIISVAGALLANLNPAAAVTAPMYWGSRVASSFGQKYGEGIDAGINDAKASSVAAVFASVDVVLDMVGLAPLMGVLGKGVKKGIATATSKVINRASLITAGKVGLKTGGAEGGTEVLQETSEYLLDMLSGINKDPSLGEFVENAVIAGFVGFTLGGSTGVAGSLKARYDLVTKLQKIFPKASITDCEVVADAIMHYSFKEQLNDLKDVMGVAPEVKGLMHRMALAELIDSVELPDLDETSDVVPPASVVEGLTRKSLEAELKTVSSFASADSVDIDANITKALELEGLLEKLDAGELSKTGGTRVTYSMLKKARASELKNYANIIKKTRTITEKDSKKIRSLATRVVRGLKIDPKNKIKLLSNLYKVEQKADVIKLNTTINKILDAEQVDRFRNVIEYALDTVLTSTQVSPATQDLGRHLKAVYEGKVPPNKYSDWESNAEMVAHTYEVMVSDARTDSNLDVVQNIADSLTAFAVGEVEMVQTQRIEYMKALIESRIAIGESVEKIGLTRKEIDEGKGKMLKANLAAARGVDAKFKSGDVSFFLPVEYFDALNALAELIDSGSLDTKYGKGPAYNVLNLEKQNLKWVNLTTKSDRDLDTLLNDVYKGEPFKGRLESTVAYSGVSIKYKDGVQTPITRSQMMSLYMLGQMGKIKKDLIENNNIDETWLDDFLSNPGFTEGELRIMSHMRQELDNIKGMAKQVFESVTGQPFHAVDDYFMVSRYMASLQQDEQSLIDDIIPKDMGISSEMFGDNLLLNTSNLLKRTGSSRPVEVGDIFTSFDKYRRDMYHFVSFAEWVKNSRAVFGEENVASAIQTKLGADFRNLLNNHIDAVAAGGMSRKLDNVVRSKMQRWIENYAGTKLMFNPKQFFRQAAGLGVALRELNPNEIVDGILDMPRAIKAGELQEFLDSEYMRNRRALRQEYLFDVLKDIEKINEFRDLFEARKKGKLNRAGDFSLWLSETKRTKPFQLAMKGFMSLGDQSASLVAGWSAYQKYKKLGMPKDVCFQKAVEIIDATQLSGSYGRLPLAFITKRDLPNNLFNMFGRFTSQYTSEYLRMFREVKSTVKREGLVEGAKKIAKGEARIGLDQVIRSLATYHVVVPFLEALLMTAGDREWEELGSRTAIYSATGPFSMVTATADLSLKISSAFYKALAQQEDSSGIGKLSRGDMISSVSRDIQILTNAVNDALEDPNMESVFNVIRNAGELYLEAEKGIPAKKISSTLELTADILMSDLESAIEKTLIWSVGGRQEE